MLVVASAAHHAAAQDTYNSYEARRARAYRAMKGQRPCPQLMTGRSAGIDTSFGSSVGLGGTAIRTAGVDVQLQHARPDNYITPSRAGMYTVSSTQQRVAGRDRYTGSIAGTDTPLQHGKPSLEAPNLPTQVDTVTTVTRINAGVDVRLQHARQDRFDSNIATTLDLKPIRSTGGVDVSLSHARPDNYITPSRAGLYPVSSIQQRVAGRDTLLGNRARPQPGFQTNHMAGVDFTSGVTNSSVGIDTSLFSGERCR